MAAAARPATRASRVLRLQGSISPSAPQPENDEDTILRGRLGHVNPKLEDPEWPPNRGRLQDPTRRTSACALQNRSRPKTDRALGLARMTRLRQFCLLSARSQGASKPVQRRSPTLGRFDSCAAPLSHNRRPSGRAEDDSRTDFCPVFCLAPQATEPFRPFVGRSDERP
jgi:hypothetical protein